jgi:Gpi18-like mannosyltransferase
MGRGEKHEEQHICCQPYAFSQGQFQHYLYTKPCFRVRHSQKIIRQGLPRKTLDENIPIVLSIYCYFYQYFTSNCPTKRNYIHLQMRVTDRATCVIVAVFYISVGAFHGKLLYEFLMALSVAEFGSLKHKNLMTELPQGSHMSCLKFPDRYCTYTRA